MCTPFWTMIFKLETLQPPFVLAWPCGALTCSCKLPAAKIWTSILTASRDSLYCNRRAGRISASCLVCPMEQLAAMCWTCWSHSVLNMGGHC